MYNKLFLGLILALSLFGFVLPYLFSAKSDELVLLGVGIVLTLSFKLGQLIARENTKEDK
jgi:glycopeptide antibiotics resistance protein